MTHWYREPKRVMLMEHLERTELALVLSSNEFSDSDLTNLKVAPQPIGLAERITLGTAILAALGFVGIAVVPALKYPANPPSVGNPETIKVRTAAFFLMILVSVVSMVLAGQIERYIHPRVGVWNASLVAIAFFVIALAAASHFLPDFDEVPAGFPVTLMWKFRVAALEMQLLLWGVLGFLFGWFADRAIAARQVRG